VPVVEVGVVARAEQDQVRELAASTVLVRHEVMCFELAGCGAAWVLAA
jgi:hypothetical protein